MDGLAVLGLILLAPVKWPWARGFLPEILFPLVEERGAMESTQAHLDISHRVTELGLSSRGREE